MAHNIKLLGKLVLQGNSSKIVKFAFPGSNEDPHASTFGYLLREYGQG